MRPARIIAAVLLAAAVAATGSYLALSTATHPSAAPQPPGTAPPLSDPQVAADRLVAAWVGGDRTAARNLTNQAVTDRLFSESPPAHLPAALPCRLVPNLAVFVCSYPIAEGAELSLFVEGGASAGYGVSGVEFSVPLAVAGTLLAALAAGG
jgi:hypothetical protein